MCFIVLCKYSTIHKQLNRRTTFELYKSLKKKVNFLIFLVKHLYT